MLKDLFRSESRVKILEELLFNPEKKFYLTQLARNSKVAPIQASKELSNLKNLGLVIEQKTGKLKFYAINRESPIYPDLRNIFLKTECLGEVLKKHLKNYSLEYAIIFGSFASGKEKPGSDIDLLLIGDANERELIKTIRIAEKKLRREINYILWSEKEFEKKVKGKQFNGKKNKHNKNENATMYKYKD